MHLYFLARGRGQLVRRFIEDLEDIYVPYEHKKGEGKGMLQVMPRKVEIYECAFPKEYLGYVLELLGTDDYKGQYKWLRRLTDFLMNKLGLQRIPKKYENVVGKLNRYGGVGINVIGTKDDIINADGIEQI